MQRSTDLMAAFLRPTMQFQNPAINGYWLGWKSCTSYAWAMACAFDRQRGLVMTGEALRRKTGDTSGGTTMAQNDVAAINGWGVNLDIRYRVPWEIVQEKRHKGHGAVYQGHGDAFNDTEFYCNAAVNHAGFNPPDNAFMDPSADGRRPGIYKFHAEPYPDSLLRKFAGRLILDLRYPDKRLGLGYAYAAFTIDRTRDYQVTIRPLAGMRSRRFARYMLADIPGQGRRIVGGEQHYTGGFVQPCTAPRFYLTKDGLSGQSLVMIDSPSSNYDGWYVHSGWSDEA